MVIQKKLTKKNKWSQQQHQTMAFELNSNVEVFKGGYWYLGAVLSIRNAPSKTRKRYDILAKGDIVVRNVSGYRLRIPRFQNKHLTIVRAKKPGGKHRLRISETIEAPVPVETIEEKVQAIISSKNHTINTLEKSNKLYRKQIAALKLKLFATILRVQQQDRMEKGDSEKFEVQSIRAHKWTKGKLFLKIRWKRFGPKHDSWEPVASLVKDIPEEVKRYLNKNKCINKKTKCFELLTK